MPLVVLETVAEKVTFWLRPDICTLLSLMPVIVVVLKISTVTDDAVVDPP